MRTLLRCVAILALAHAAGTPWAADLLRLKPVVSALSDTKGTALNRPEGVAIAGDTLAVADTGNGRFVLYRLGDRTVTATSEITLAEIQVPIRLQFDPSGDLVALDAKTRRIGRFAPDGKFKGFVSLEASGSVFPRSFRIGGDGTLYVLDTGGARVIVAGADGKVQREIALPPELRFGSDVAVDAKGTVFVLDSVGARVFSAAKDAAAAAPLGPSLREDLSFATSLAVDEAGHLFVLDEHGGGVVILAADGAFRGRQAGPGWTDGLLRYPSSICVDPKGRVFVADRENQRVQMFEIVQ